MAATCLLMGTAIAANETPQKVTSSTPEGVTYGVDQKYKAPPDTSRYANIKTAAGCVALLVLIGSVPTRATAETLCESIAPLLGIRAFIIQR